MKALLYVLVSIAMKTWYEKLREKNMPVLILKNIEKSGVIVRVGTHFSNN